MTKIQEAGLIITQSMTQPSRPGKAPRPVWEVRGQLAGWEDLLYDLGGKKWRGAFSFWEDPTERLEKALATTERSSFADRQAGAKERAEARAERYEERAQVAEQRSTAAWQRSSDILAPIPPGQPILVGHHSERGHRRTLEKADNAMRKSCEERDKAQHYASRAAASARNASDKSVGFMARRLKEAEAEVRRMERMFAKPRDSDYYKDPANQPAIEQWERNARLYLQEQQEKVAYWRAEIEAAGGIQHAPKPEKPAIKKGDYVFRDRGDAYEVLRVNPTTVTGQSLTPGCSYFKPRIPFAEIKHVVTAEEFAVAQARKAEAAG